ncbi:MAG: chemotaxis protein CheW [Sterolibacterium sp.]|jgi:twitching motility protein PilI|nr:chemotaxis protein CheW [Sterolibacterium sp.]
MAKRISLREFQMGLVERLTSAVRGETSKALLGVQAGKTYWLLNLSDAGEIVPLPPLMPTPLTKPWFAGVANIRGTLYSVVDFSAFQGGEPTPLNNDARLLLIGARHGINSALLVSKTLGLKPAESLEALPTTSADGADVPWVGAGFREVRAAATVATVTETVWRALHVKPLLSHPGFLDISR